MHGPDHPNRGVGYIYSYQPSHVSFLTFYGHRVRAGGPQYETVPSQRAAHRKDVILRKSYRSVANPLSPSPGVIAPLAKLSAISIMMLVNASAISYRELSHLRNRPPAPAPCREITEIRLLSLSLRTRLYIFKR